MNIKQISYDLLNCLENKKYSELLSKTITDVTIENAYEISSMINSLRTAKGEILSGIKIGFTNKSLWEQYNVDTPIFGIMYDTTIKMNNAKLNINKYLEPKIEPEIYFKFSKTPSSKMSDYELLACCSSFGIGIEIVNSIYKDWKFSVSDAIAGFGLHAEYSCLMEISLAKYKDKVKDLSENLSKFSVSLMRDGLLLEKGHSSNILAKGPIEALRRYVSFCEQFMPDWLLLNKPITTGTITNAHDICEGERYTLKFEGLYIQELEEKTLGPIVV